MAFYTSIYAQLKKPYPFNTERAISTRQTAEFPTHMDALASFGQILIQLALLSVDLRPNIAVVSQRLPPSRAFLGQLFSGYPTSPTKLPKPKEEFFHGPDGGLLDMHRHRNIKDTVHRASKVISLDDKNKLDRKPMQTRFGHGKNLTPMKKLFARLKSPPIPPKPKEEFVRGPDGRRHRYPNVKSAVRPADVLIISDSDDSDTTSVQGVLGYGKNLTTQGRSYGMDERTAATEYAGLQLQRQSEQDRAQLGYGQSSAYPSAPGSSPQYYSDGRSYLRLTRTSFRPPSTNAIRKSGTNVPRS